MSKVFTITQGLENLGAFRTGGQGSVYKGRRIGEIITAVKLLPTPIHTESKDNKNYRDFMNEVEKLKKVNEEPNPNIVKILSSGLSDSGSFPFIEMEYIVGPDLEDLLKAPHDRIFTIKEVIRLAEHLANALAHCHKVNVKHGDIKSNNVKYNIHSGNYVLLDFGLAIMSDEQRRTSMRQAGAIEFMAPEQSEGLLLMESDIYSYGVVLYEMLAGQVPFLLMDNGETARNNVRLSHLEYPVPDMISLRRDNLPENWSDERKEQEMQVPVWLTDFIGKCLDKKPENRYRNGMELKEAFTYNSVAGTSFSGKGGSQPKTVEQYKQKIIIQEEELATFKKQYDRNAKNNYRSGITIPLPIFLASLLFMIGLLTFAGYKTFKQETPLRSAYDTNNIVPVKAFKTSGINHEGIPNSLMTNVLLDIDSIKREEIKELETKNQRKTRVVKETVDKKKKRKKFLGIF